jgi:hypothetical protein
MTTNDTNANPPLIKTDHMPTPDNYERFVHPPPNYRAAEIARHIVALNLAGYMVRPRRSGRNKNPDLT